MALSAETWERVQEIFNAAVDLPPAERAALLERECAGDMTLRDEVESLLASDEQATSFIEDPASAIPRDLMDATADDEDFAGRRFGAYQVLREIGRGGLGAVYLAARADEQFEKQVAIKVVRRGLDTDDILRRFRAERQILAQLDHPNIARLTDAGSTEEGLPYFVMEYIDGESITSYCETHRLSTAARLELFRQVCSAITYAHQHLVIHRDIKPSNILVTKEGVPKLLDFGIAKVLHADDPLAAHTMTGVRVMTPEYASPEQVRGLPITTASDIYSLGVLLYKLLTNQKPYRLTSHTSDELSRAVLDQIPERPSTAVARRSESAAGAVIDQGSLRGDLDNIVLMAMRKEPERRYASAAALADDIRRHLEGLPVAARPNTLSYRAGKFINRHRAGAIAGTLVLLSIIGGLIATLWQAGVAQSERAKAEKRFNDVRKLANSNLFDVYPEIEHLEGSLKAREAILRNALAYLDSLSQEATGDSELQSELATAYEKVGDVQGALNTSSLGNVKAALGSYAKARQHREAILAAHPRDLKAKERLANNVYVTARTLWNNSETQHAEAEFQKAIALQRELVAASPDSVESNNRLALLLIDYAAIPAFNFQAAQAQGSIDEALEIIARLRRTKPEDSELKKTRARGLRLLSKAKTALGDHAGGLTALHEARSLSEEVARAFPQDFRLQRAVWLTDYMICELLIDKRDGQEAARACAATIPFPDAALAREPENAVVAYDLANSHFNAARAFRLADDSAQTIAHSHRAIDVMSKLSAKSPANTEYKRNLAIYRTEMARAQIKLGQNNEAIAALHDVEAILRPIVEADPSSTTFNYDLAFAHRLAAQAFHNQGASATAVEHVDAAIAITAKLQAVNALRASDKELAAELASEKSVYVAGVDGKQR
jgi:serine/threonine protein kinase